jgi:ParB family transcriptional regulator, chromosome partitioning protein
VARAGGLGKGLGALIPSVDAGAAPAVGMLEIPTGSIRANPNQPREYFDEETLDALAESIREVGILQPVLVREADDGYELIAGERRWRAARRVGLQTVPAIVRVADDALALQQAIVENVQREGLDPLEEAAAYQQLIEDFQLTHEDVARRIGKSRATVTNCLRLLQLPATVQRYLHDGSLRRGHAIALLGTPDRAFQEQLARRAVAEDLSVRALEETVRMRSEPVASMMRRFGDRLRASWVSPLGSELDAVKAELTTAWTSSFDELRRDIGAEHDSVEVRVADHNLELLNALHRVADAFASIGQSLEADRRDRHAQLDAVEFLLREMVIGFAQPTAVSPVVLGGTVDPAALGANPRGEVDIDLSDPPIPVDAHVEVHSRFEDHWVHGFAIAEYVSGADRRGYRLRRLAETEPLPLLFDAADVRRTTAAIDHPALDTTEETRHFLSR